MKIVFDSGVSGGDQDTINAAVNACTYPLNTLVTVWTVYVRTNPGHSGRNEALTTIIDSTHAQTEFAPGLFIPGDPLYVDEKFIEECVAHELGHVASLGKMNNTQFASFASMFGFEFPLQWDSGTWENMGKEAVAETFKDLFMPSTHRHFLNRTNFMLTESDEAAFVAVFASVLGSPTVNHSSTATVAMSNTLQHEYGTAEWVADMAPMGIPGIGQSIAADTITNPPIVDGLYAGIWERFMERDYNWADVTIWEGNTPLNLDDIDNLPDLATGVSIDVILELLSGHLVGDFLVSFDLLYLETLPSDYTSTQIIWLTTGSSMLHPFTIDNIGGVSPFALTNHTTDNYTSDPALHPFPDEPQAVFNHATGLPVPDSSGLRVKIVNHPSDVPSGDDGFYLENAGTASVTPPGPLHFVFSPTVGGSSGFNGHLELIWPTVGRDVEVGNATFTVSYTTGIAAADVAVPAWPYPPSPTPTGTPTQIALGAQSVGVRRRPNA